MAPPDFHQGLTNIASEISQPILLGLGLDLDNWRASYGVPSETGSLIQHTSIALVEPRDPSYPFPNSLLLNYFNVLPGEVSSQTIILPNLENEDARELTDLNPPGIMLITSMVSDSQSNPHERITITATHVQPELDNFGFHRVKIWDSNQQEFIIAQNESEMVSNTTVIFVPNLRNKELYLLPYSEIQELGNGLQTLNQILIEPKIEPEVTLV